MYQIFIQEKCRLLHDFESGEIIEISRLEKEMLPYISKLSPLPEECPTGLRYSLAKYESSEVEEAYSRIFSLAESKKISLTRGGFFTNIKVSLEDPERALAAVRAAVNNFPTVESITLLSASEESADAFARAVNGDFSFITVIR